MAADPKQLLRILAIRGVTVRLEASQLVGRMEGGEPMPADMIHFIRQFKPIIIAELSRQGVAVARKDAA